LPWSTWAIIAMLRIFAGSWMFCAIKLNTPLTLAL
jgi:hypothetical protein